MVLLVCSDLMSGNERYQVIWGTAGPLGQPLANLSHLESGKSWPYLLNLLQSVMQDQDYSYTPRLSLCLMVVAIDWLNMWEQQNSWFTLCSGVGPTLPGLRTWVCDPVRVVGRAGSGGALQSSSRRLETDGGTSQDSTGIHFILFYFSHVKLAVFGCSGCFLSKTWFDLTPVFSFALHASYILLSTWTQFFFSSLSLSFFPLHSSYFLPSFFLLSHLLFPFICS